MKTVECRGVIYLEEVNHAPAIFHYLAAEERFRFLDRIKGQCSCG